jgi:iron complex outermembrane recepter protein
MRAFWTFGVVLAVVAALGSTASAQEAADTRGEVTGTVVDARTGEPLPGAAVRLRELGRGQATGPDGRFRFERVPARAYTVGVQFLGYLPLEQRVQVEPGGSATLTLRLEPSTLELPGVVVTGTGRERGVADTYRPTAVLDGQELQRSLEVSLAETLRRVPGLRPVYNGPAATRPTIRGMGGDRVLVLEDGQRTGDLSSTGPDHGTAVDPLSAERIEVVRGPAGLLYGPNALGGVINVWREEVPRTRPARLTGTASTTAETVNEGAAGHLMVTAPAGPLAVRAEATARRAGDTRTPEGVLPSSGLQTISGSVGASLVAGWGFAGLAYRGYDSRYSVPGTFQGVTIPGAHPNGVEIEMRRHVGRLNAAYLEGLGPFSTVELDAHLTHYQHDEIEGRGADGQAFLGARFDQLSGGANLVAHHDHDLGSFYVEGAVGASFNGRDLIAAGGYTGTRSAREVGAAVYAYEEVGSGAFRVQLGARYDLRQVTPRSDRPIRIGDREVPVEARSFGDVSASAALLYDVWPGWTVGATAARAFRSPAIEELYSDGPHLADYSFDVGNPRLGSEIGHGLDLFVRATRTRYSLEAAVFANRVSNFVYYQPTGELDDRFRRFPVFAASAEDALFLGFEGRAQVEVVPQVVLDGTVGYVRASRLGDGDPLPAIPPLAGGLEVRYETRPFSASLGWEASAPQRRVAPAFDSPVAPGETIRPEGPTDGYGLLNAGVTYRLAHGGLVHTLSLQGRNLTDAVWRDHLSRIKEVAPQAGRSLQLSYRVQF